MSRGYFEIGILNGKTIENAGTLWRSAFQFGAAGIFTIGKRYKTQASDTLKTWKHVPMREHTSFEHFLRSQPYSCPIVAIEMGGTPLPEFEHPERAIYLLGAEDHGIPAAILAQCQHIVSIPSVRTNSFNVATAGALVMYDRAYRK